MVKNKFPKVFLRKVQKINKSLWVSLPIKWTKLLGLNKGDEIVFSLKIEGDSHFLKLKKERRHD